MVHVPFAQRFLILVLRLSMVRSFDAFFTFALFREHGHIPSRAYTIGTVPQNYRDNLVSGLEA